MIEIKDLSFTYSGGERGKNLVDINLDIRRGEVLLLCGESGCGKTTLTRLINGLIPHFYEGELEGSVTWDGVEIGSLPVHETGKRVGSVFQNPRSQFFNVDTTGELVFACENQGMGEKEIRMRLDKTMADFRISALMDRNIFRLSGGEKQKIACASVSAVGPDVMVLDEPSSSLDMAGIENLRRMIEVWKGQGKTIVVAEHRLFYLRELISRVVFMKEGRIEERFGAEEFRMMTRGELDQLGLRPLYLEELGHETKARAASEEKDLQLSQFCYSYRQTGRVLDLGNLIIPRGCAAAIVGGNGSGKTTFARCLCGLSRKFGGQVEVDGRVCKGKGLLKNSYMVMQDVNHQLFAESVLDEVMLSMGEENERTAEEILRSLDLLPLKDAHPLSLSGGQKQRVAIAGAVASEKEIIIFDEPTSGLDLKHMREVAEIINGLAKRGKTVLVISHDLEFILGSCTFVFHLHGGKMRDSYLLDETGTEKLKESFLESQGLSPRRCDYCLPGGLYG